jgi:Primase X
MAEPGLFTLRANEDDVADGINSLLNLFELIQQPLFPRTIMTASYTGFFVIHSLKDMYKAFMEANFQDCRISAYPPVREETRLTPNLILLDIDYNNDLVKNMGLDYADNENKILVDKIIDRLRSKFQLKNLMVMKTGNGRHILVPFLFEKPFEYVQEMRSLIPMLMSPYHKIANNIISENFLPFAKKYLSNDQADKANYPKFSNVFLRVPGTLNMKMKYGMAHIIRTELECEYDQKLLPNFGDLYPGTDLLSKFHSHMCLVAGNQKDKNKLYKLYEHGRRSRRSIPWIETLYTMAVSDCRKRIIRLILAPYAINVKRMPSQDAFIWIKNWAEKCNKVHPFDRGYNVDQQIEYLITRAQDNGYFPISRNKIIVDREDWKMKGGICLDEFIENKMKSRLIAH